MRLRKAGDRILIIRERDNVVIGALKQDKLDETEIRYFGEIPL